MISCKVRGQVRKPGTRCQNWQFPLHRPEYNVSPVCHQPPCSDPIQTQLSLLSISFLISTPLPPTSCCLELSVPCGPTYCPYFCVTSCHPMGHWPGLRWLLGDDMALLDPCSWAGVVGNRAGSCGTKPGGGAHGDRVMGVVRGLL